MLTERQKSNADNCLSAVASLPGFRSLKHELPTEEDKTGAVEVHFTDSTRIYWVKPVGKKWVLVLLAQYRGCECGWFDTYLGAIKKIVSFAERDHVTS